MKKHFLLIFLLSLINHPCLLAQESILNRFLPAPAPKAIRAPQFRLPPLPNISKTKPDVADFNKAVDFNNSGLDDMRAGNYSEAERLFSKACRLAPSEKGFWNNYLLSLNKTDGKKRKAIQVARKILALDSKESQAAYLAGIIYLNDLKDHTKALQYLNYAHMIAPDDPNIAIALATAYERAGFTDDAFEILKKYAHRIQNDPYPFYLLGLQYLKRNDFNSAIRALTTARNRDNKGYAHDALIRAKYFAGQLEGLANECYNALFKFPNIINKKSIKRIYFSLKPQKYKFTETIAIKLNGSKSVDTLAFLVKMPPDIPHHQKAKLYRAELISNNKILRIKSSGRELDGKLRFKVPSDFISPLFYLKLTYQINVIPWFGSKSKKYSSYIPDIKQLKKDKDLNLAHPMVRLLSENIKKLDGNYVQNATIAVVKGLKYKENFEDHNVEWIFSNLSSCDCTEFSRLLASLCLINNIPARVVTGFLVKSDLLNKPTSVGHAWCEVFFKDKGWFPIDPTLQSTMHWAYFGNLLSDQILFNYMEPKTSPRVSVDFVSTSSGVSVNITDTYVVSLIK